MNTRTGVQRGSLRWKGGKSGGLCLALCYVPDGIAGLTHALMRNRVLFEWWARTIPHKTTMNVHQKLKESILHDD